MEGQKADENRQKSLFLWKIWQLSFEKGTYFDITGNAAICLGMDGNTIIELFTSYYDVSETSQNASEVFQNSFFFWSSLRPRELKELFTVHRPRHFFLPHQKVIFCLFEGKFSFFFHNFYVFSAKQNKFSKPKVQKALQSSKSPIVKRRHVLNYSILLLCYPTSLFSFFKENGDHPC